MNEIRKENDMFTTTLFNPESTTKDLIGNGLNTSNTQLLTPEQYKETPLVKKYFTDENGVFNEPLFNQVYAEKYKHPVFLQHPQYEHKFVPYPAPSAPAARPAPLSHPESPWFPASSRHTAKDIHRYISQLES